ncbi:glutathione hydrolase 1 proenzyme-like [Haemaphysalis longicornis]
MAKDGATVGDVAVSTLFCMSVLNPHITGIGGGFVATYYHKNKVTVLDAIGVSPAATTVGTLDNATYQNPVGPKTAIVPGALKGFRELLQITGSKVSWADLIKPAIELATNGFKIDAAVVNTFHFINRNKSADLL